MSHVLVPLAQGCEELEAITITDLLVRAGVTVTTCGLDEQPVKASRGTTIIPDTSIDKVMDIAFDLIVLPGGLPGSDHLRDNEQIQLLIKKQASSNKYIAAICAAPKALAKAGLLEGKTATSFPGVLAALENETITISENAVEIDGNIVTSRSVGTAMDFALSLIELLEGKEKRDEINQQLAR
ncbi:DJ-1/YajL/PfpI superfamily, includes chaperone protein YajL (former ThiJ), parkinsonism-associated protein DJ-1, peptidases PfpI, Hsp31 [hydrothermal vent metagenome]|uniref:DJ-1/YajL/PfpI superfamily, includes chaperone protein YajL (Former ThiJ), parkinsonism-associated protein DJ-1, peptidases PfpI, Hsp31 n=1 Tax=hydrothermal vent metagenome TaxID=652676 RepID=A0A3B0XE80_9ZZZZ